MMGVRKIVYSIFICLILINCEKKDISILHSDIQYLDNLIYSISDTTLPYTGIVKEFTSTGETEFTYNVENGEMVGDIKFYDEKGKNKPPVSSNRLVERNDILYMVNQEVPFNGCVIDTYQNGQYKYKYFLIDGLQSGTFKSWTMNGKVTGEYLSIDGNINGDYSEYWNNDTLRYNGEYLNNLRVGTHISYFDNGRIDSLIEYDSLGRKDGVFRSYYDNGQSKSLRNYSEEVLTGDYQIWDIVGTLRNTGHYDKNGNLEGIFKIFDEDGSLSIEELFKNGVKSRLRYFTKGEMWLETTYKSGKKHLIRHYPNDPTHILHSVVTFENGEEDVGWKEEYFSDGTLKEKYQVDGLTGFKKVGEFYEYKEDGSLWIKGEYTDNRQSGVWVWYDKDGEVTSISHMDD